MPFQNDLHMCMIKEKSFKYQKPLLSPDWKISVKNRKTGKIRIRSLWRGENLNF